MRIISNGLFVILLLLTSTSNAQPDSCDKLLAYNTTIMSRNVAARYAVLQRVNIDNYEAMKTSATANVPGYFDGSYDDFSTKRNRLSSMLAEAGSSSIEENFYQHALSPEGAKAYAECAARQSNKPISAWISSKQTGNRIAITVRNGMTGNTTVEFTVTGEKSLNEPIELTSGTDQTLQFEYNSKRRFLATFNARVKETKASASAVVDLPPLRVFVEDIDFKVDTSTIACQAGCGGNTIGCRQIRERAKFVAPGGYSYNVATLREVSQTRLEGPGVYDLRAAWAEGRRADGSVETYETSHVTCEGNSAHTLGASRATYELRRSKPILRQEAQ